VRQRFTIAHEIGHAVLTAQDFLYVDKVARLRDARSAQGTDPAEVEANAFAAELLMPADMLEREVQRRGGLDVYDQDDVLELAGEFQVSTQALLIRLNMLGLAPAQEATF
jgi:Zn-dependent peptidase ImmA (M78 family)